MKVAIVALALLVLAPAAMAQDAAKVQQESGNVFQTILNLILKWVFPVGAAYCFIHGVIAKGVKRGEWDMAALCVIGAVALALFPKLLEAIFQR